MKFPNDDWLFDLYLEGEEDQVMTFDQFKERYKNIKWPTSDRVLEGAWRALGDVPTKDTDDDWILDERFETPWVTFEKGVSVMDVWRWFDGKHSKGVHWLMYGGDR